MASKSVNILTTLVAIVFVCAPLTCHAEKDPEAAARQARIDEDMAEAKVQELQRDQAIAADVQIDNSDEMAARQREIAQLQAQANKAERQRLRAEAEEE